MLDESKKMSPQQGEASHGPEVQNSSVEQTQQMPQQNQVQEPEDIFAETEHAEPAVQQQQPQGMDSPRAQAQPVQQSASPVKKLIIILIFVILIAGIGYGMYWYYNKILAQRMQDSLKGNNVKNTEQQIPVSGSSQTDVKENINEEEGEAENKKNSDLERILEEQKAREAEEKAQKEAEEKAAAEKAAKNIVDTDQDGLTDEEERAYGTNPERLDTDADGLFDKEEILTYKTDPLDSDSDGDGFSDGAEVKNGYNPNGPGKIDLEIPANN